MVSTITPRPTNATRGSNLILDGNVARVGLLAVDDFHNMRDQQRIALVVELEGAGVPRYAGEPLGLLIGGGDYARQKNGQEAITFAMPYNLEHRFLSRLQGAE